jgi:branched-chain amino acid transport system ATP-binding protein
MLKIHEIDTYYGKLHILKKVSLEVKEKEIVSLIGANGAGKTTLLQTIIGINCPRNGFIEYNGRKISDLAPEAIVKEGISLVPEGRHLFTAMSVTENLEMGAYLRKDRKETAESLEMVFNLFPKLREREDQLAGTMSGGEQQMLAIARALMAAPKILLCDEPSFGLSPIMVQAVGEVLKQIKENEKVTILLVEQNAMMALQLSARGYVIELGSIILEGTSEELLQNENVRKAYLGL